MNGMVRSVLVVDPTASLPVALAARLRSHGYYSEAVASAKDALELACSLPFDIVVVVVAGTNVGLRDLARTLRLPESASRETMLLAVADGPAAGPARDLLGRGVNRVLAADAAEEDLVRGILELVESSPRVPLKAVIRFRARFGADERIAMCQTEDVSATGVFVRTQMALPQGAQMRFELAVPGQVEPIRGTAEVARQLTGTGGVVGLGLRFLHVDGDGRERLRALVASRITAKH